MKCPHCESENVIKAGELGNKHVTKQGHRCKDCRRYFIERDGLEGMTYPKEITVLVLHLFVEGVILISSNRIERYHSKIALKIRSMRGVKNLERGDRFFQVHNFVHNFSKKGRLKRILDHLGLKPSLDGLTKLFYIARNF